MLLMRRLLDTSVSVLLLSAVCLAVPETATVSTVETLLKQANGLQVLALGERHKSIAEHAFLTQLARDPGFPGTFPVIVVEFGNGLYQGLVDEYVAGRDVSSQALKSIWQNTTVPMAWDSPLYAEFFAMVKRSEPGGAQRQADSDSAGRSAGGLVQGE
jgi:hypothetical protein